MFNYFFITHLLQTNLDILIYHLNVYLYYTVGLAFFYVKENYTLSTPEGAIGVNERREQNHQKTTTFNTWCHSVSGTVDIL